MKIVTYLLLIIGLPAHTCCIAELINLVQQLDQLAPSSITMQRSAIQSLWQHSKEEEVDVELSQSILQQCHDLVDISSAYYHLIHDYKRAVLHMRKPYNDFIQQNNRPSYVSCDDIATQAILDDFSAWYKKWKEFITSNKNHPWGQTTELESVTSIFRDIKNILLANIKQYISSKAISDFEKQLASDKKLLIEQIKKAHKNMAH